MFRSTYRRLSQMIAVMLLISLVGCPLSEPARQNGVSLIYDGVEFRSNDEGKEFGTATFEYGRTHSSVELVFPDGFAINPMQMTRDTIHKHMPGGDVRQDDGKGSYHMSVSAGQYASMHCQFENHQVARVTLMSHADLNTISIKVRDKTISVPIAGEQLKAALGSPNSDGKYVVPTPPF